MIDMPDGFKKLYKVGNVIKRTYAFSPNPPKPEIIEIKNVNLDVCNEYGHHNHFTGYSHTRGCIIRCRTMYYKGEKNINDVLVSREEAIAIIL